MKQRIITGIIFGIVVLFLVNYNITTATIFLAIVGILSAYEYFMMIFTKELRIKVFLYLAIEILLAYILVVDEGRTLPDQILLYISLAYIIYGIISLYLHNNPLGHRQFALFHIAIYIVVPFVLLYKFILNSGINPSEILMSILAFIWISDSAAYFVGSKMGKNKLFERISPKKTWEGSIGAGIITILIASIIHFISPIHSIGYWVILAVSIWVIGSYGDLYESSIKRKFGIKDSGTLLPGHGGFLDRFDSFIFVVPVVLLILSWMK